MVPPHISKDQATKNFIKEINRNAGFVLLAETNFLSKGFAGLKIMGEDWVKHMKYRAFGRHHEFYTLGLPAFEDAKKELDDDQDAPLSKNIHQLLLNLTRTPVAPLHYGRTNEKGRAWFNRNQVNTNLRETFAYSMKLFGVKSCEQFLRFNNR